jgi:hypothetical protein
LDGGGYLGIEIAGTEGKDRKGDSKGGGVWGVVVLGFKSLLCCVLRYSSVFMEEGAIVRDCQGIGRIR